MRERRMPSLPIEPLDAAGVQIPYYFRCPISLELMTDPVTVCTGQTYDRSSIESWVSTGNITCPVTRSPLSDFTLIPNHTLRRLIQEWCVANRSFGVERIPTPKQPADPSLVRSLLNQVASGSNLVQNRVAAMRRIRGLARDSEKNRLVISAMNVRDVVISILFSSAPDLCDELRYESLALLAVFPPSDSDCPTIASDPGKIQYLVNLLFHPTSIEVRVNSASLLESVIAGTKSPELRSFITAHDEVFPGVVALLTLASPSPRALKVGVKTLFALCLNKQHRHKAVSAGAVDALIMRLAELDKCDCERALATVELLCRIPQGCAAFASHALTVPLLVKTILKVSDRATEYAAGALLSLCSTAERLQIEAVNAGVLTQLLLLVQSDCTERAKRKAQMLLKLLRNSWPDHSIGISDDFNCSDVVPF
ncbi:U-box domain-containing protein 26-like [Silene latifolia]|uniref:U-box domain-containing protein 26-like n=1 Tax=Silene latifolia TaxID=37657 RepID=UPI003D784E9F